MRNTAPTTVRDGSVQNGRQGVGIPSDALLRLLVAVRGSSLPKEDRMALRDQVLAYSQLEDAAARVQAEQELKTTLTAHHDEFAPIIRELWKEDATTVNTPKHPDIPVTAKPGTAPPSASGIGRTRPAPVFTSFKTAANTATTAAVSEQSRKVRVVTKTHDAAPTAQQTAPLKASSKTSATPDTQLQPAAVDPVRPQADTNSNIETEAQKPTPRKAPASAATSAATTASSSQPGPKERIVAIKHAVNAQFGNPINIMERDRAVGQEYMTALLEAIKRSGGDGDINAAMQRLEQAYQAVEKLDGGERVVAPNESAPSAPTLAVAAKPPTSTGDVRKEDSSTRESFVPKQRIRSSQSDMKPDAEGSASPSASTADTPARWNESDNTSPKTPLQSANSTVVQQATSSKEIPTVDAQPAAESKFASLRSLAADAKLQQHATAAKDASAASEMGDNKMAASPMVDAAAIVSETRANKGPGADARLYSKDVDAGLEQLLSEWKLFKSSGMLGTGPRGKEHPLYKKLAGLPMAAVVAGRFEGATPAIKQNITDYMNGWRYEQGIMHEMDEQFEHYLRRVIRHIMSNQQPA